MRIRLRSLRVRAPLVVALVVIAMPLFAWLSHFSDSTVGRRMHKRVRSTALLAAAGKDPGDLARRHSLWVRIVDIDGQVVVDQNHDPPVGIMRWSSDLFFGPDGAPTLADWDAGQPEIPDRALADLARRDGHAAGCVHAADGALLVCTAAFVGPDDRMAWVQESSRRAIRGLYDVRYQLVKLTLQVLAMGIILGLWLGWRMVRPVEILRRQVLDRTRQRSTEPVLLDRDDELGDLAESFNQLLAALEERRRANEDFAADMVHELKNPVAAVRVAADALKRGEVDQQRAERLAAILDDASQRLDGMVSQFLDLARAEAGLRGEEREEVDLRALLSGVVEAAALRHEDVAFELDGHGPDVRVSVVPGRLETAVRNLLDNAAAFAREGEGRARVEVRLDVTRGQACVEVLDTGPGIAAQDLDRVFERYFTRRHGGTGLGLSMSLAIAQAHGGSLVALPSQQGARLRLCLPVRHG